SRPLAGRDRLLTNSLLHRFARVYIKLRALVRFCQNGPVKQAEKDDSIFQKPAPAYPHRNSALQNPKAPMPAPLPFAPLSKRPLSRREQKRKTLLRASQHIGQTDGHPRGSHRADIPTLPKVAAKAAAPHPAAALH